MQLKINRHLSIAVEGPREFTYKGATYKMKLITYRECDESHRYIKESNPTPYYLEISDDEGVLVKFTLICPIQGAGKVVTFKEISQGIKETLKKRKKDRKLLQRKVDEAQRELDRAKRLLNNEGI